MAIYFFDSRALAKRYVTETGTVWVQALTDLTAADHEIYVARAQPSIVCRLEINAGFTPQHGHYNIFIQIGIGLKAGFHRGMV